MNANVIRFHLENTLNTYTKQNLNPRTYKSGGFLFIKKSIIKIDIKIKIVIPIEYNSEFEEINFQS